MAKREAQRPLGGAASSLPAIRRRTGNEDVAPPVWLNSARKLLAGCIAFCDSDSCAKLFAELQGWDPKKSKNLIAVLGDMGNER